MNHLLLSLFFAVSGLLFSSEMDVPEFVPKPNKVERLRSGFFIFGENTRIVIGEKSLRDHAEALAGEIEILTGLRPAVVSGKGDQGDVVLEIVAAEGEFKHEEAYLFLSGRHQVKVTASSMRGISYGTATLLQAIRDQDRDGKSKVMALRVKDHPAADFRTMMLDVARMPHSIGVVKDVVRLCRLYKVKYLQLHLTDDQHFTFPFEPIISKVKNNYSYTREELVKLVTYAETRGVTIIPELDLPGHSSRLKQADYLSPDENDADVASPENYKRIHAIIDDMLAVFHTSPYFHIGGDESAAGSALVPFLQSMNQHVRKRGKRLLVWEGFHGAPVEQLPPAGDDRIIVVAWESTYNAPWDLLKNGYQIVNASWKPTYIVGGIGSGVFHPGSSGGRKFTPQDLYQWDKNTFMHWEPGRPVYEISNQAEWKVSSIGKEDQVIGGQMLFWEQAEQSVMNQLRERLPVLAERLWNPNTDSFEEFQRRYRAVESRIIPIVQPVAILPGEGGSEEPVFDMYRSYEGEKVKINMINRTRLKGTIRFTEGGFQDQMSYMRFPPAERPTVKSKAFEQDLEKSGGFSLRAQLFTEGGQAVDGTTWQFYNNWPMRVKVVEYDLPRKTKRPVPDLERFPKEKIVKEYEMPMVRGLMRNVDIRGQMTTSYFVAPGTGEYEIGLKTQSGHASLYLDLDQNGLWGSAEKLISDTPNDESEQWVKIQIQEGECYPIRFDHLTGMPRPVLIPFLRGPGLKKTDLNQFLQLEAK
ncbi:MAG: family 20 glycosylhydrolase [Akkermansiaceae bacterium]